MKDQKSTSSSRRDFLKQSTTVATTAALASAISPRAYAAGDDTIKVALIGCGGRGTGAAAQALSTKGPVKLVAMADVFENKVEAAYKNLTKNEKIADRIDVPQERKFFGLEAYKAATEAVGDGGLVLLTTPPAFRPIHVEHAVNQNRNIFMEKSFGVDAPGVRKILASGELATKKNLKVAGGLMSRHKASLAAAIEQIHGGAIGDIITCWGYREHGPVGYKPRKPGMSELEFQIQNYSNFSWVNGTFILDWLIHNLDICCWVKDAWPVSAQGQGGRQVRTQADQLFDHIAVEYTFPDGTRLMAQGRLMAGCWGFFGDVIHGTHGSAVLGEGVNEAKIYKGHKAVPENLIWEPKEKPELHYQVEHDRLFDAIRNDRPYNETERCCYAAMTGILGRMAAESGKEVTWDEAMASDLELAPGLADITDLKGPAPVQPDADGNYPVAMPGLTKAF